MSFGAAKTISQRMGLVNKYKVLILDLTDVPLIGVTASLAIENMVKDAYEQNRQVILVSNTEKVQKRLQKLKLFRFLSSGHNFSDRLSALQKAITYIEQSPLKSQDTTIANPEH